MDRTREEQITELAFLEALDGCSSREIWIAGDFLQTEFLHRLADRGLRNPAFSPPTATSDQFVQRVLHGFVDRRLVRTSLEYFLKFRGRERIRELRRLLNLDPLRSAI